MFMARFLLQPSVKPWNYYIPDDILVEIFLRLPARSLYLFRSVSRHWLAVIQSPIFIHLYNNHPKHINNPILLVHAIYDEYRPKPHNISFLNPALTFLSDGETTPPYKDEVSLKVLAPSIYYNPMWFSQGRLLGPCNGLFCITDTVDVGIFNPVTKKFREVPRSCFNFVFKRLRFYDSYYNRVCFGLDSASSDYKVVGFRDLTRQQYNIDHSDGRHYFRVEIFSLRTNSWTLVNSVVQASDLHRLRNHDLFFNNAVHWFGCAFNNICAIVVFDLKKEAFKLFQLPGDNNFTLDDWVYLSVMDESFTVILHRDLDEVQIWSMKEYGDYNSWTELYNISVGMRIRKPLSFGRDGEFLFEDTNRELVSFNLKTRLMKKFKVNGIDYAFRYRESLVY